MTSKDATVLPQVTLGDEKLFLLPLDRSDDLAYELFNTFFVSSEEFNTLARTLAREELAVRVETSERLYYHFSKCVEVQQGQNRHLGFDPEEVKSRFVAAACERVRTHLGLIPLDAAKALDEVLLASADPAKRITLFSVSEPEILLPRVYALSGLVAAMRGALDL